jgi:AAA domain
MNRDEFLNRGSREHRERRDKAKYNGQGGPEPFPYLTYDRMSEMTPTPWLIRGVLPARALTVIYGESNSYKSFIATDLACSVATGRAWHGVEVGIAGNVLFVVSEGAAGLGRKRIPAWMAHKVIPYAERFRVFLYPGELQISNPEVVDAFIASARRQIEGPLPLIVVDLMLATMGGSENKDEVVAAWVRGATRLQAALSTSILTVTHSPYGEASRMRGHSHLSGSFDTRLAVEGNREDKTCRLLVERHKDHDSLGKWDFRMETMPTDEHPDEDSLVPVLANEPFVKPLPGGEGGKPGRPRSKAAFTEKRFIDALVLEADDVPSALGYNGKLVRKVRIDAVRERMKRRHWLDVDDEGKVLTATGRGDFLRAKRELEGRGEVVVEGELVWRP